MNSFTIFWKAIRKDADARDLWVSQAKHFEQFFLFSKLANKTMRQKGNLLTDF